MYHITRSIFNIMIMQVFFISVISISRFDILEYLDEENNSWVTLVPIIGLIPVLGYLRKPKYWAITLFIPVVGLVAYFILFRYTTYLLAKKFNKEKRFLIFTIICPMYAILILAAKVPNNLICIIIDKIFDIINIFYYGNDDEDNYEDNYDE